MVSKNELINYLNSRKVNDNYYRDFILNYNPDNYKFSLCTVNGFDFVVSHFLDQSKEKGCGIIATNEILKTDLGQQLAIGLIEGDDVICLDIKSGQISIWMIQTGDGEHLIAAESFRSFLEKCCE